MYESPIEVIIEKMQTKFENGVFEAVQKQGIFVDKEELVKALQYDREQYDKGYADGLRERNEWISVEERLPEADTNVLVITANASFKVARCNIYHNGTLVLWMTNDGLGERAITHWMPLPEPPKGE